MFGISTLQIKLIALAALLAFIGYTYYWTFNKGVSIGGANAAVASMQAMKKWQEQNLAEQKATRDAEMKEAAEEYARQHRNDARKIADLKKINDELKNEPCGAAPVPAVIISLLDSANSDDTPTESPPAVSK